MPTIIVLFVGAISVLFGGQQVKSSRTVDLQMVIYARSKHEKLMEVDPPLF